jgi:hypothetical protein
MRDPAWNIGASTPELAFCLFVPLGCPLNFSTEDITNFVTIDHC